MPKGVEVQVLSWAPKIKQHIRAVLFCAQEASKLLCLLEDLKGGLRYLMSDSEIKYPNATPLL